MDIVTFNTVVSQSLGLMFRKPKPKTLYIFDFKKNVKISFHMFFVRSPIDLYLLDHKKTVVEVRKNFCPFQIHYPKHQYRYAIETAPKLLSIKAGEAFNWTEH